MATAVSTAELNKEQKPLPRFTKTLIKLLPHQIEDEIQIALLEMKKKGITAGIAAAMFVVALVFLTFMVTSLLVSLIAVIAGHGHLSLIALFVALGFLVLAAIFGLIGYSQLKKALPLKPSRAIHGVKYDLGVVKEGSDFNERSLYDTRTKEQREADAKRAKAEKEAAARNEKIRKGIDPDAKPLTLEQYKARVATRRGNIMKARDGLLAALPIAIERTPQGQKVNAEATKAQAKDAAAAKFAQIKGTAASKLEQAKGTAAAKLSDAKEGAAAKAQQIRRTDDTASNRVYGAAEVSAHQDPAEGGTLVERLKANKAATATAGAALGAIGVIGSKLKK